MWNMLFLESGIEIQTGLFYPLILGWAREIGDVVSIKIDTKEQSWTVQNISKWVDYK
jgi:hypothetical protein